MKLVATALLVAALSAAPAVARDAPQVYTAGTTGELVVDTEGRVVEVTLDRKALGDEVMQGFEDRIRQWRFEPVLRDGAPVRAKASMSLGLIVIRQPGVAGLRLGFERVQFFDPAEREARRGVSRSLAPPTYPRSESVAQIGGRVNLLLQLDPDGRVVRAAAESVNVYGDELDGKVERHARNFSRAAEQAASRWTIPGIEGGVVVVPVTFSPYQHDGQRWIRTRGATVEVPAWVAIERASRQVIALGEGGLASSERWKLLTPLDG